MWSFFDDGGEDPEHDERAEDAEFDPEVEPAPLESVSRVESAGLGDDAWVGALVGGGGAEAVAENWGFHGFVEQNW